LHGRAAQIEITFLPAFRGEFRHHATAVEELLPTAVVVEKASSVGHLPVSTRPIDCRLARKEHGKGDSARQEIAVRVREHGPGMTLPSIRRGDSNAANEADCHFVLTY